MRYLILIFLALYLTGCGFKPIYKLSENNLNLDNFQIIFNEENSTSREIKDEIKKLFISNSKGSYDYKIEVVTSENITPILINPNGTVSKYRIEITIDYKLVSLSSNEIIINDTVRGFSQYSVVTSEIENNEKRSRMIRTATNYALQIMISKLQSSLSRNDN